MGNKDQKSNYYQEAMRAEIEQLKSRVQGLKMNRDILFRENTRFRAELAQVRTDNNEIFEKNKKLQAAEVKRVAELHVCITRCQELRTRAQELREVFDHPNDDAPRYRYLYEIIEAIKLLKLFSRKGWGGEHAFGTAMQLEQFHKRATIILMKGV